MYKVQYHKLAEKGLDKLASKERLKIVNKITKLAENPYLPNLNSTSLKDLPNGFRLRVGKMRVVYEIVSGIKTIIIWKISPRGSAYSY